MWRETRTCGRRLGWTPATRYQRELNRESMRLTDPGPECEAYPVGNAMRADPEPGARTGLDLSHADQAGPQIVTCSAGQTRFDFEIVATISRSGHRRDARDLDGQRIG